MVVAISVVDVYFSFDPSASGFVCIPSALIMCLEVATLFTKHYTLQNTCVWLIADCYEEKKKFLSIRIDSQGS